MSALTQLTSTTGSTATTLPSWYDTAQQNIVNQAQTAASAAPQFSQTVGQNAINQLGGTNGQVNPFAAPTTTLNQIASGAANPFTTNAQGQMTPDTSTPLGGLYAAQQQQLQQMLPTILAQPEAQNIGSGNFGSLRGQTANATAEGNALATLQANQLQNAIQNQTTGVNAAKGAADVGQMNLADLLSAGQTQMAVPFQNTANEANIIGGINAPTTVNTQQNQPLISQITSAAAALGGLPSGVNNLLTNMGIKGGLSGLSGLFNSTPTNPGTDNSLQTAINSGQTGTDANGNALYTAPSGTTYLSDGTSVGP